jgi:hypothetical protein
VRYQYAAPLSVQYDGLPRAWATSRRTVPADGGQRFHASRHDRMRRRRRRPVRTEPAGTVARSPCCYAHGATVQPDGLLVERIERGSHRAPADADSERHPLAVDGEQEEAAEADVGAVGRIRTPGRRGSSRRVDAASAARRGEHRPPTDGRNAGGDAVEVAGRPRRNTSTAARRRPDRRITEPPPTATVASSPSAACEMPRPIVVGANQSVHHSIRRCRRRRTSPSTRSLFRCTPQYVPGAAPQFVLVRGRHDPGFV